MVAINEVGVPPPAAPRRLLLALDNALRTLGWAIAVRSRLEQVSTGMEPLDYDSVRRAMRDVSRQDAFRGLLPELERLEDTYDGGGVH